MTRIAEISQIFNERLSRVFERAKGAILKSQTDFDLGKFFNTIDFKTEAETLLPENIEKTKQAFFTLCEDKGWIAVKQSFEELLAEKSGRYAMRGKDDSVPNWYHEFRQVLPTLSALHSHLYTEKSLNKHGGIEALLTAKFRHDSYEDYGKTPTQIFAGLERRLHEQNTANNITDEQLFLARNQASIATDVVGLVSKKTKFQYIVQDHENPHDQEPKQEKIITHEQDFFDGDDNAFYRQTLEHYFAYELKTLDGVEGLSTRVVPDQFLDEDTDLSVEKNLTYARKKRSLYGRASMDKMATEKWPEFKTTIRSIDSMLRLNLVALEIVNDYYAPDSKLKARNAFPMRVNRYMDYAFDAYEHVPKGFNPLLLQIERCERIAQNEITNGYEELAQLQHSTGHTLTSAQRNERQAILSRQYKMAEILENAIYPSLVSVIGDRRGTLLQKSDGNSFHNQGDNPELIQ